MVLADFAEDGTIYGFGWVLGAVIMVDWLGETDHCAGMYLGRDVEDGFDERVEIRLISRPEEWRWVGMRMLIQSDSL
jgi:hypothetical protein